MKAIKNLKIAKIAALLITSSVFFTISGCQKEDLIPRDTIKSETDKEFRAIPAMYSVISIDHKPGRVPGPDYKVVINSNGLVVFEGRNNTAFSGTTQFMISEMTVDALRNMFIEYRFEYMPSAQFVPDLPYVTTSFRHNINSDPVVRSDNDGAQRTQLIMLRKNVETLLGISGYVSTTRSYQNLEVEMNPKSE